MHPEKPHLTDSATFKRLFWPAVWLVLFLLAFATWRIYWKMQLENEKAMVRAAGYPADLEELDAWYKKPVGRNAAEFWVKAQTDWVTDMALEDWMPRLTTQSDTAAAMYEGDYKLGLQYPDEVLDKVRAYWAKNEASWLLMQEAAGIEGCRWDVDLKKGMIALMPYLGEQKKMANLLAERMRLAGKEGDWAALLEMMGVGFKLGDDFGGAPNLISGLVDLSVQTLMVNAIQKALPFMVYQPAQLEKLQGKLQAQRMRMASLLAYSFRGEAADTLGDPLLSESLIELKTIFSSGGHHQLTIKTWTLLGGEDHDRAKLASYERKFSELGTLSEMKWLDESEKIRAAWEASLQPWEIGCKRWGSIQLVLAPNHLRTLVFFDTAIAALAIERYRLDHGKLPATLSDLVPAYLPAIPGDAFNSGKPLRYKIEADRFTVYSFGRNQVDDGGTDNTDIKPHADDITFTILLPNAKRGIVPKRTDLPEAQIAP